MDFNFCHDHLYHHPGIRETGYSNDLEWRVRDTLVSNTLAVVAMLLVSKLVVDMLVAGYHKHEWRGSNTLVVAVKVTQAIWS